MFGNCYICTYNWLLTRYESGPLTCLTNLFYHGVLILSFQLTCNHMKIWLIHSTHPQSACVWNGGKCPGVSVRGAIDWGVSGTGGIFPAGGSIRGQMSWGELSSGGYVLGEVSGGQVSRGEVSGHLQIQVFPWLRQPIQILVLSNLCQPLFSTVFSLSWVERKSGQV